MILMLERDEAFFSKCDGDDVVDTSSSSTCPDQTRSLLNVHFVAMLMQMLSPFVGHTCDTYGPFVMMIFTSVAALLGVALLIVSRRFLVDWLLYPAFMLLDLTGNSTSVMIMITGRYFAMKATNVEKTTTHDEDSSAPPSNISNKKRRRAIGVLNNLFDGGSVTYLLLWEIQKARPNISLQELAVGYFIWGVFLFGGALFFWKRLLAYFEASTSMVEEEKLAMSVKEDPNESNEEDTDESKKKEWKELLSPSYLWLNAFFAFHVSRQQFMLTSAEAFLKDLGDDDNTYIETFTYILPASILVFPFVDIILARFGYHAGLQGINILALIHATIQISSDNLNVQIIGFVVFSIYRSFMFGVIFPFLGVLLQPQVLGKANGLMHVSSGIMVLINIPLGDAAIAHWGGSFFIPNLIYTITIAPFVYAAWRCSATISAKSGDQEDVTDTPTGNEEVMEKMDLN